MTTNTTTVNFYTSTVFSTPEAAYFNGQGDQIFSVNGGFVCVSINGEIYTNLHAAGLQAIENGFLNPTASRENYRGANRDQWIVELQVQL